jgi:predicted permease
VAIATVALGIGATSAIYSVIDATLLHPLPYPHPTELVHIQDDLPGVGAHDVGISTPELKDLQNAGIFQYVSIYGSGSVNLTGSAQPTRIVFKPVTPNYFGVLGVEAQLGRTFDPHDTTPGFNLEVVISDGLWKRAFAADPQILGKTLRLDNDAYHVVGVMPAGFRDQGRTSEERNTELWAASNFAAAPAPPPLRSSRLTIEVIARLKPGLSIAAAQRHLDALVASLKKQFPEEYPPQAAWTIHLIPLSEAVVGSIRQALIMLFGAVGLVLLISCVNVANLLLARASARGREISVRQALGATRTRLIRQLLTESLLLFLLGGITGFAILFSTRHFLLQLVPESLPHLNDIAINWGVLGFAVAVSVTVGILFGLAPAWLMSRVDLTGMLRASKGSSQRSRARRILVVSELALSLVLLVAAGLLLRSFWDLFKVQLGFNPERVMAIQSWLPVPNDPKTDPYGTATQESVLLREILRRSRNLPGVEEAAVGNVPALPLGHGRNDLVSFPLIREGSDEKSNQVPLIESSMVSPEYFHLMGMTLLRGRSLRDQDLENTPSIALINEAAARTYWPNQEALGRRVRLDPDKPVWTTIVGIIANARTESLADAGIPQIFLNVYQRRAKDLVIFLRGPLTPAPFPGRCVKRSSRSMLNCRSSTRRPWTRCSPGRFRCGGFRWKWLRCSPRLPCYSPDLGSTEPSLTWSMSRDGRWPFASRWAHKEAVFSGWCCFRVWAWQPPAPPWAWWVRSSSLILWPACSTACCLPICRPSWPSPWCLAPSRSPPATYRRCAPCAWIPALRFAPNKSVESSWPH